MSGKIYKMRSAVAGVGMSLLVFGTMQALAQDTAPAAPVAPESPQINQTPAPGENLTPTQPQLQELPSVADLADRLLPAVVARPRRQCRAAPT
jgi:hypothetical protein